MLRIKDPELKAVALDQRAIRAQGVEAQRIHVLHCFAQLRFLLCWIGPSPVPPRAPVAPATTHRTNPALTAMLTDPALTGMSRTAFEYLVAVSEPFWDALAEAAFQRRFHRPRSYRHPQTSSVDHTHRLLAAILRRRRAVTMTFLAQLLGVNRTNLSIQYQDAKRLLDLHRILVTPIPGSPARTLEQLQARTTPAEPRR